MKIANNSLLCQRLNEYMKLAKIIIVSMLGSVEDELIFSILAFMKDKLQNQLGTFGCDYSHVCTRLFYSRELPLSWGHY